MTFELPSGLLERLKRALTTATNDDLSEPGTEKRARQCQRMEALEDAIASIPAMVDEIGRLDDLLNRQKARTEEEAELYGNALNDIDRLRALNAEMREALEQALDDMRDGYSVCPAAKEQMHAILAKSQEAAP